MLAVPALLRDVAEGTPDMRVRMDVGDEAVAFEIRNGVLLAAVDQGRSVHHDVARDGAVAPDRSDESRGGVRQ